MYHGAQAARSGIHPLVWLAERRLKNPANPAEELTLERLSRWLAVHVGLPYFHIDPLKIDVESVTSVISIAYATRYRILPVAVTDELVTFATAEPYEREWEQELSHVLRCEIARVLSNPLDVARYQEELFGLSHSIRKAGLNDVWKPLGVTNVEALVELGKAGKLDANDRHIVSIVDWLFQYAFDQRASDIHLEPRREVGNIRFRIDGMLHLVYQVPTPIMLAVTSRIKTLGRMDIVEKRRPQDGRVKTKTPSGQEVELRLSTMPTAFGEKLVMRIFDPQVLVRSLSELGFSKGDAQHWSEMTAQTHGIVLVTGPTGSGKTTTLYSTLKALAHPEINLCTIEDPIEMVEDSFNQMQVNQGIGLDFATGVRTLMRQDPDIIMVGEIRDLETAEMAIQAALTGHLVLSTLHTNDASSALTRLQDIGVPHYLISATLLGVVAQRLIRTLCPHCKAPVAEVDEQAWKGLTYPWKLPSPERIMGPVGCEKCRETGYLGRMGIYEILRMTQEVRNLVGPESNMEQIRKQGLKQGMEPLRISGVRKIMAGLTSMDEVLRVTPVSQLGGRS
ncbi:MAG: GspE/PulE family protein [Gammaproteobacteria bacterium]|nr:GspE/PulE family protein [Gammaproteobacteria bacterium]MBU1655120.1 GspE/PulE family protein [Gammaproteobacteria bacterium]MBU1961592.1 GspE/PulE family protein [Gammaproteobacteria bacterium]